MSTIELSGIVAGSCNSTQRTSTDLVLGMVSTYPPTACGLATFTRALVGGLDEIGVSSTQVVSVGASSEEAIVDPRVTVAWQANDPVSMSKAVYALNACDVVMIQHEFGIFGGDDGLEILELMERVKSPIIVTLHTVPINPSSGQRRVLERVIRLSSAAVTMTNVACERLLALYRVDPSKVVVIPHGATIPTAPSPAASSTPILLTWGLLGPGKGIEYVIQALAMVQQSGFPFRYVISGRTHPKVFAQYGERYRNSLMDLVTKFGLEDSVTFDSSYKTLESLLNLVASSSCVVLPYESMEQTTSGVLVDAIAASRPVISTPFPHAVELLHDGAGILVPPRDPRSMAMAISRVVSDPVLLEEMERRANQLAPMHAWSAVAAQMNQLAHQVVTSRSTSR